MTRRAFVSGSAVAAAAAQDRAREGGPRIRLGFDAYSIRGLRWKAIQLIDYGAALGLDAAQISIHDFESLEPAHLAKLREHAAEKGMAIDAAMSSICPTSKSWNPKNGTPEGCLRQGIRAVKAAGSRSIRVFVGSEVERRGPLPIEAHIESTLKVLRAVRSEALDAGIKVAIENHKDMTARELRGLIEAAGKDFVGACLDFGNPMAVLEDPGLTLEVLGEYAVTTHVRDSAVCEHPRGAQYQWVALGDGSLDFRALMDQYRRRCPDTAVQLEIITGRPPQVLPYLEPEFWKAFPKLSAADFARFVALARRGRPYLGPMLTAGEGRQPAEYEAALRQQQRADLERSLTYAREALGLGLKRVADR